MGCFFLTIAFLIVMNVPLYMMGLILPFYTLLDMVDFLAQAVVDRQLVMVCDAQFLGHHFGGFETDSQDIGRGLVEIPVFFLGDNEQVDRPPGTVVLDNDYIGSLIEDLGRQVAVDNAGEY